MATTSPASKAFAKVPDFDKLTPKHSGGARGSEFNSIQQAAEKKLASSSPLSPVSS